jgi:predicted SprT family Zn-dependent metalloprotease
MTLQEVYELSKDLLTEHGFEYVRVEFGNAKRQAGLAVFDGRTKVPKIMRLSKALILARTDDETKNTILHEIAHFIRGANHGHDAEWVRIAKSIGCTGEQYHTTSLPGQYVLYVEGTMEKIRSYHKRPTDKSNTWIKGRKEETCGKLKVAYTCDYEKMVADRAI